MEAKLLTLSSPLTCTPKLSMLSHNKSHSYLLTLSSPLTCSTPKLSMFSHNNSHSYLCASFLKSRVSTLSMNASSTPSGFGENNNDDDIWNSWRVQQDKIISNLYIRGQFSSLVDVAILQRIFKRKTKESRADSDPNSRLWEIYVKNLIPELVKEGYNMDSSTATFVDAICLEAISKKIHDCQYSAETKYHASPDTYKAAIRAQDKATLRNLINYAELEEALKRTARQFCAQKEAAGEARKTDPILVVDLYIKWIIPLVIDTQVEYLLSIETT